MVYPGGQPELMQLGVWSNVVSRFQAAAFAVVQSLAPATGMFVVLPQLVSIAFCSMATDQLCGAAVGGVKTARATRAKAEASDFFMAISYEGKL
jgi:hypothetical protein